MNALAHIFDSGGAFTSAALVAFLQVIFIDLVLAGDNAVVIGLAASGLPISQRGKAITVGIAMATVLRIAFATVATWMLAIIGLLLAGGILLLWVCWKMWRELRASDLDAEGERPISQKTFFQAASQIVIADVSMSLDNVLAVAGAARAHPIVLAFGLIVSISLMGAAANVIASLLTRHRWIAYAGLAIIVYVATRMVWDGANQIVTHIEIALR